jgi:drug/metabolite transporter (DMT)-like permease
MSVLSTSGLLAAMLSAILFSGKGVLMKLAFTQGASLWLFMALRMIYAMPFFLLLWFRSVKRARLQGLPDFKFKDWIVVLLLGLVGYYLSGLLDIAGLRFVSAGMERLILYTHPSLVVLFGWFFLRRKVGKPLLFAMGLSYAGLVLAFVEETHMSQNSHALLGGLMIFGSAMAYALFLLYSGQHLKRLGHERLFVAGMLVCTVAVLIQSLFKVHVSEWVASGNVHVYALIVAVLGTVVPTMLLGTAIQSLGPERTAILGTVGPVFTLFLGHFTLHEPLTWLNTSGLALTLAGGWVLGREQKRNA